MNVPIDAPVSVEIDPRRFLEVINGIERAGALLAARAKDPEEALLAYEACCNAMRAYFDQLLIEKFPPSYKA